MKRIPIFFVGIFLLAPFAVSAESPDPTKDLKYDIEVLQYIIMTDLSKYPLPVVKIIPEAEFDAIKLADNAGEPEEKWVGYQPCETDKNLIMISSAYEGVAKKFQPPMDPAKYFRRIRAHELYHWANCIIAGSDRFFGNKGAWSREEHYALMVEARFAREQLGKVAALLEDYQLPPRPNKMPEGSLPETFFQDQEWKLMSEDQSLAQWPTISGSMLFVGVASTTRLIILAPQQTSRQIPTFLPSETMYLYNAIMHRGRYVGFEEFELYQTRFERRRSWWDKGYVPVWKNGKGFALDNPVYAGEWVRIVEPEVKPE